MDLKVLFQMHHRQQNGKWEPENSLGILQKIKPEGSAFDQLLSKMEKRKKNQHKDTLRKKF